MCAALVPPLYDAPMTKLAVVSGVPAIPAILIGIATCVGFGMLNGALVTSPVSGQARMRPAYSSRPILNWIVLRFS